MEQLNDKDFKKFVYELSECSEREDELKLCLFYNKNLANFQKAFNAPELTLLSHSNFIKFFDPERAIIKGKRISKLIKEKEEALNERDLFRIDRLDKALFKERNKDISEYRLEYSFKLLIKIIEKNYSLDKIS